MVDPHVNNPTSPKFHVRNLTRIKEELKGEIVLGMPAGNEVTSEILQELGSKVGVYDVFPEYFLLKDIECKKADINQGLRLSGNYADFVICQKGIEHFNDQPKVFTEYNRVLKIDDKVNKKIYYGHVFLIGMQKMRILARVSGFKLSEIIYMRTNKMALCLFPLYYPFIFYLSILAILKRCVTTKRSITKAKKSVPGTTED